MQYVNRRMPNLRGRALRGGRVVVLVLSTVLFSGCYLRVKAEALAPGASRPATCPEAVAVFVDAESIGQSYVALARLTIWHPADMKRPTSDYLQHALRKKAATLGANGLILARDTAAVAPAVAVHVPADTMRAREACAASSRAP